MVLLVLMLSQSLTTKVHINLLKQKKVLPHMKVVSATLVTGLAHFSSYAVDYVWVQMEKK